MKRIFLLLLLLLLASPAYGALTDNLESYWELNEASGDATDAHGSNDLSDVNTVGSATGKVGNARDFESTASENLQIPTNASVSMGGNTNFTAAFWINAETLNLGYDPVPLSKGFGVEGEYGFYYGNGGSRMVFYAYENGGGSSRVDLTCNNAGALSLSTWYFVVGWHDADNDVIGCAIYGAASSTANTSAFAAGIEAGTSAFALGAISGTGNYWDGLIDEVGLWKRVLTSDERTQLYNSGNGCSYADLTGACAGAGGTGAVGPLNRRRSQ